MVIKCLTLILEKDDSLIKEEVSENYSEDSTEASDDFNSNSDQLNEFKAEEKHLDNVISNEELEINLDDETNYENNE